MPLIFLDILRNFFEGTIGTTQMAALIAVCIILIFLLFMNASKEAVVLIPLPILIVLGGMADSLWMSTVAYIIAGVYFAGIILSIYNKTQY